MWRDCQGLGTSDLECIVADCGVLYRLPVATAIHCLICAAEGRDFFMYARIGGLLA
jgi:hypothetical protein